MSLLLGISLQSLLRSQGLHHKLGLLSAARLLKTFSSKAVTSGGEISEQEQVNTFKQIYRFDYIRLGYAINKFKWPQTIITAFTIPSSVVLYFCGVADVDILMPIVFPCIMITGNVYTIGELFHKSVGFIYISEDEATVKISYLDFWGARIDKEFPVEDIMPLPDCPRSPTDYLYRTIHVYSTEKLKIKLYLHSGGRVTDEDRFLRVFGEFKK